MFEDEGEGTGRPRKPDADILSYIRSLESLIEKSVDRMEKGGLGNRGGGGAKEEGSESDGDEGDDEDGLLVENLIEELNHKFASVAMDRHAAPVMEKVARLCTRTQLAKLLSGCLGYALCLATNRYSSHVLQTLLSLVGPLLPLEMENGPVADGSEGEGDEDKEVEESLQGAAIKLAQELHSSCLPLMQDISGTHTIRALLSLLTGMPVVAEKRGRYSKHQHSIETAVVAMPRGGQQGQGGGAGKGGEMGQRAKLDLYPVPDAFHMMLESMVHDLSNLSLPTLHEAICHPYSGPALCLLVQEVQVERFRRLYTGLVFVKRNPNLLA